MNVADEIQFKKALIAELNAQTQQAQSIASHLIAIGSLKDHSGYVRVTISGFESRSLTAALENVGSAVFLGALLIAGAILFVGFVN